MHVFLSILSLQPDTGGNDCAGESISTDGLVFFIKQVVSADEKRTVFVYTPVGIKVKQEVIVQTIITVVSRINF